VLTRGLSFVIRNAQQWARAPVAIAADTGLAAYVVSLPSFAPAQVMD
jgi:hypothetical protein